MYAVIVKSHSDEDARLKFKTFEEAAEHARMVIIQEIAQAVSQTLGQDDISPWLEDTREMVDLIPELYENDRERFISAVERWEKFAKHDNYGDMWVEFI